jgi:ubiquinone/menaquinone biosynthesis C-methylase UbiE
MHEATKHESLIKDQFTRQAVVFSTAKAIADEGALNQLVDFCEATPKDTVLDLACGGGLVVCAFAPGVRHATGIDMTPAMLDRARALAEEKKLANVSWHSGDVMSLPYPDAAYDIVVTRFSFHHLLRPLSALREMARVCVPGGRIVVADVVASPDQRKANRFNHMELLRDPSHVRNLPVAEFRELFAQAGLGAPEEFAYELRDLLDNLLGRSFPNHGDEARIRELFAQSLDDDCLGISLRRIGPAIEYAYPVQVFKARRM